LRTLRPRQREPEMPSLSHQSRQASGSGRCPHMHAASPQDFCPVSFQSVAAAVRTESSAKVDCRKKARSPLFSSHYGHSRYVSEDRAGIQLPLPDLTVATAASICCAMVAPHRITVSLAHYRLAKHSLPVGPIFVDRSFVSFFAGYHHGRHLVKRETRLPEPVRSS
jgi:hypothetical protein